MTQKTPTSATRRAWSYKAGEKGRNRVRVFAWGDSLWIDYRENGRRIRKDLGHTDTDRAKCVADEVAAGLARVDEQIVPAALTLRTLFDMYEREVTPGKGDSKRAHDARMLKLALRCWGGSAVVASLDRRDWDRFIEQRRKGTLGGRPCRDGTIRQDLSLIVAVMHWAESVRVKGRILLDRNPFQHFPMPKEMSPRRPMTDDAELEQLRAVASRVHPLCPLYLEVAYEVGHRMNAIAQLRWSDVDFARQEITWRAEGDKIGAAHVVPVSSACIEALRAAQRERRAIGDAWVFPSKNDPSEPISRFRARDWWRRLEKLSGIRRIPGRGWHSLRRKFATDHMDVPTRELMALGGWKSQRTLVECYQQPREAKLREALERRSRVSNGQ